jgi:hypothetical protein
VHGPTVCGGGISAEHKKEKKIMSNDDARARLEYLRAELRAERVSYGELHELQNLTEYIEPGDVELLEPAGVPEAYAYLPIDEREWLMNVSPTDIRDNAHRFYGFMAETGHPADSFTRELAFTKATEALGIDYDVLYDAWLDQKPII